MPSTSLPHLLFLMPASVASEDTSAKPEETGIDILALKELAKRSLVEALNSVRSSCCLFDALLKTAWCK